MQERGRFHAEEALASTGDGVYTIGVSAEVTRSCFLSASQRSLYFHSQAVIAATVLLLVS